MNSEKGKITLRISMGLVFLYFGFSQLFNPGFWTGYIPKAVENFFFNVFGINSTTLVLSNAFLEIVFGVFLLIGLYVKFSSLVLSIHLFGIAFAFGFTPLGIRDLGLALATLSVFFNGADRLCLDKNLNKLIK